MGQSNVLQISDFQDEQENKKSWQRDKLNKGKKGSVYSRNGKLWVYFSYMNERVREPVGLVDTPANQKTVRHKLDLVIAEINNGTFQFSNRFPHSKRKDHFTELEGRTITKDPSEITFKDYVDIWWEEMKGGMSDSQIRDYESILSYHLIPYFGKTHFIDFKHVLMKKFIASLKGKKNQHNKPISAKRIHNIFIPLRVIVNDAFNEYGFDLSDPFAGLKLPIVKKPKVHPFDFHEWQILMTYIRDWYRPYFEFAVNTGLRPSEQVALKWSAIEADYFDVELSRVRNKEKDDLKTQSSHRRIEIRQTTRDILKRQKIMTKGFASEYVFINLAGRPILQDKLRELWLRAMKKSGLKMRRMYETRHTFASWALGSGESPEWVARVLGHVDTSMVYKTYGRYIPNLTRMDGTAFERQFDQKVQTSTKTSTMQKCGRESLN